MNPAIEKIIDNKELDSIRTNMHKIAEFIALFETAEEKLKAREKSLEQRLMNSEKWINEQLLQIKSVHAEFQSVMTDAGAARWRVAAEKISFESEQHLENIREATEEFIRCSEASYQKLNKATDYTLKGLSKAIHSFRMDDFQKVANTSVDTISYACETSLSKMSEVIKWFHWRNIALVFSITIVATMITGLYINDEWPWQSHQQALQQRQLALAVESAWPRLSLTDQQEILHTATQSVA